ncbi:hypothetical protein AAULR_06414, partial [Lacticaseibacillus rhamnosus MTCC 5462]
DPSGIWLTFSPQTLHRIDIELKARAVVVVTATSGPFVSLILGSFVI